MTPIKELMLWLLFVVMIVGGLAGFYALRPIQFSKLPYTFSLKQGSSLKSAANQMQKAGVLPSDWLFVFLARGLGKAAHIKPGNYLIDKAMSPIQLLDMISKGRVEQSSLSIIEGWTFKQLRAALNRSATLRHDSKSLTEQEIMKRIGAREKEAEGLFFPDTYNFSSGSSDILVLKRAYQLMQKNLRDSWKYRTANLPFKTKYQALILASIVEKETGKASDRNMIAAVFVNRLKKRMLLQTDPTVIYGLGNKFDGNLRRRDLKTDSPYNTYMRTGLTPTPISLPGMGAIQAVLHPAKSKALYFVAKGDGSSHFSKTLNEHNRAVNRYQK